MIGLLKKFSLLTCVGIALFLGQSFVTTQVVAQVKSYGGVNGNCGCEMCRQRRMWGFHWVNRYGQTMPASHPDQYAQQPQQAVQQKPIQQYKTEWKKEQRTGIRKICYWENGRRRCRYEKYTYTADVPYRVPVDNLSMGVDQIAQQNTQRFFTPIIAQDNAEWEQVQGGDSLPNLSPEQQPTPQHEVNRIVRVMKELGFLTENTVLGEIGCGDARFLVTAVKESGCRAYGIEIDSDRMQEAMRNVKEAGLDDKIDIFWADAKDVNLASFGVDTVYVYLFPETLEEFKDQLKDYQRVVSRAHSIPGMKMIENDGVYFGVRATMGTTRKIRASL